MRRAPIRNPYNFPERVLERDHRLLGKNFSVQFHYEWYFVETLFPIEARLKTSCLVPVSAIFVMVTAHQICFVEFITLCLGTK